MKKSTTIELPSLYGDHHVVEVRRLLLEMPGVDDVYASSAFHVVEATFDPEKTSHAAILGKLSEAGYLEAWVFPTEIGSPVTEIGRENAFFRHTATYETNKQTVSFQQTVSYSGRPLWNCPGFGVIRTKMED